jgi:hypothetical protein
MKVSNEDKVLIGVGSVAVIGLGYLYWKKKQNEKQVEEIPDYIPDETPTGTPKSISTGLDRNKLLSKGSKGAEVRELQRLLNVKVDGDFGKNTLTALQKAKGVLQISLNQFQAVKTTATPVIKTVAKAVVKPTALPKAGVKLMVKVSNATLYKAKKIANGSYTNTGEKIMFGGSLGYGESAGTFKSATANGTYLVQKDGNFYFINGTHVKPY